MTCELIGKTCKLPTERIPVSIPLRGSGFIRTWEAGRVFASSVRVRPAKKPNGFEYECTTAGQTGSREPSWPETEGGTVTDGSVVWTCRAISNASLARVIASCVWSGGGLTVDGEQIINTNGEGQVSCYVSGGVSGSLYEVTATITFNDGAVEAAKIQVTVD